MAAALITAFDELDEANGERIGGPSESAQNVLRSLEARILATRAETSEVFAWKVRHLKRALTNDWDEAEVTKVAHSIERDLATMIG